MSKTLNATLTPRKGNVRIVITDENDGTTIVEHKAKLNENLLDFENEDEMDPPEEKWEEGPKQRKSPPKIALLNVEESQKDNQSTQPGIYHLRPFDIITPTSS